jgi:hypothetical protein
VLRAQGRADDADELEHGELARVLAVARLSAPDQGEEEAIFAEEDERVANATVLAELLVPLLSRAFAPAPLAVPASPAHLAAPAHPAATTVAAAAPARAGTAEVPPIADLIEGMLSQERTRPGGRR